MKVETHRSTNEVSIGITYDGCWRPVWFKHTFGSEEVAIVMESQLREQFEERVRRLRKAAYFHGKRAARHPEARLTEFAGCFNDTMVGW